MQTYLADVKDKTDRRCKIMLDCLDAKNEAEARKIAERYGEVLNLKNQATHHRCPGCGRILKGKTDNRCKKCSVAELE